MANVGFNPTFGENSLGVEAHLLDFEGDLYGQDMTVRFRDRIRDERKFKSVEELVRQIEKDVGYARSARLPTNPETEDPVIGGRREGRRQMKTPKSVLAVLLLLPVLAACTGGGPGSAPAPSSVASVQQALVAAVERSVPAVVNIRTVTRFARGTPGPGRRPDGRPPEYLVDLLEENGGFRENSLGSGVIVGEDGLIVTNEHVIRDADEIVVRLSDRSEYRAKVVGADVRTDVAVLRIQPPGKLPVATLGDSSRLRVGEFAIAVGNPFGLESTVTLGVVSATGRSAEPDLEGGDDFIQTDASINPGNSGGPLLNARGEVVGINTAMVTAGQGIGFAIPINTVRSVEQDLVAHGTVRRGWLGLGIQVLPPELADAFGAKGEKGILVNRVVPGSPAERGGVRMGDILVAFGKARVSGVKEFQRLVAGTAPGSPVTLEVLREGKTGGGDGDGRRGGEAGGGKAPAPA